MAEIILISSLLAGIYMAWNIGANDVANGMASAVGAKAISLRQAVVIGGLLDFVGATFIGSHVTTTIRKEILDVTVFTDPDTVMLGLLAALLAAAFWVFFSTWSQFPVSTTHSIVGAVVGFGLVEGGLQAIQWLKLTAIIISWVISPVFAGLLAFLLFSLIRRQILRHPKSFLKALRWTPVFLGATVFIVLLSLFTKTALGERLGLEPRWAVLLSLFLAVFLGFLAKSWMRLTVHREREEDAVEEVFRRFQVFTSCYVALAHGANDVANAIGPVAAVYAIYMTNSVAQTTPVPVFLLALGGLLIAVGVFTWGYKVIETVGSRITTLTNTRGFSVDFGTATSVLIASKIGIPVSTTHAAVGAVVGVGLAGGIAAVDFKVVWRIMLYWVVTLPLAALPTMLIFIILKFIFL